MSDQEWLGMHGPVLDPKPDSNGRAMYCLDECICSHCHVYSHMASFVREQRDQARLEALVWSLMTFASILLMALSNHGWTP